MAKINFDVVLKNLEGKPLKDGDGKDLTMARACRNALHVMDEKATGDEKYKNYVLALKVGDGGDVDLKSEEITRIKDYIGKNMYPIVVGPVWDFLEGLVPAKYVEDIVEMKEVAARKAVKK